MVSTSQPHLLYVAWGFPPSRGAGMYRALATANAFVRAGWRVTVLTATRETFDRLTDSDPASELSIDERVGVVRVPFDLSKTETDLSKWSRFRITSPLLWNYLKLKRDARAFPEPGYGHWRKPLVAAARRIHAKEPISLVIGTANPNVDFAPGAALHKSHGVPYVMDYRDTWNLNVYSGKRVRSSTSRAVRLERRLLGKAHEVWFVNDPIRQWHAEEYPDNASSYFVVANGYDEEFLPKADDGARRPAREALTFGYLGTIYGPMPLRESLEGWRLARARSELLMRSRLVIRGRLGHYSTPDAEVASLLSEYEAHGVTFDGPVSKAEVASVYNTFDALVLILGASRFVTSGKVFEYAGTGLPIVSLHDVSTASSTVLDGYPGWFLTPDLERESVAQTFVSAAAHVSQLAGPEREAARAWSRHLARSEQLAPRIRALTSSSEVRR